MKTKITLKTAIKAKKCFNKKIERFCWEKMKRKLTCLTLLWKREKNYVGYVGLVGKNLESYVEMVAGLPRTNKK